MAFDASLGKMVLFGGRDAGGARGEFWAWDGASWQTITPSGGVPADLTARWGHTLVHDVARGRMMLFGGQTSAGPTSEVWQSDATGSSGVWTLASTPDGPTTRAAHVGVYDQARGAMFIVGGNDGASDDECWQLETAAPHIDISPINKAAASGGAVEFGIIVGPGSPVTYRWRKNRVPLADGTTPSGSVLAGVETNVLRVSNAGGADVGGYDCVVTNVCALVSVSGRASLIIGCAADFDDGSGLGNPDGGITIDDLLFFITTWRAASVAADLDDGSDTGTPDGGVTIEDLLYYLERFGMGC
jgi:hypothetical protein